MILTAPIRSIALVAALLPLAPRQDDPVVLRFADEEARAGEVEGWLIRHRGEAYVPRFAGWYLARTAAERRGITVSPEAIRETVEEEIRTRVDGAFGGDPQGWVDELAISGRSAEGYRQQRFLEQETELLLAELARADRTVDEARVLQAFEAKYGPGGRRVDARVIYLPLVVDPLPGETAAETRARRAGLRDELEAHAAELRRTILEGADFAEVARRESKDPTSAANGGRHPNGFDTRTWPEEARRRIAELPLGAPSEPIFARGGFWIVQPEEETVTAFDDVRGELRAELLAAEPRSTEVNDVRDTLWRAATITVLPSMQEETGPPDAPVLDIDGQEITRHAYGTWLRRYAGELMARTYAEERVVLKTAARQGITCTDEEVLERIELQIQREIDAFHLGDREVWRAKALAPGEDEADYKRRAAPWTRVNLLVERLLLAERTVAPEELRAFWEETYGPDGHQVELRWIRLDVTPPPAEEDMTEERWRELVEEALRARTDEAAALRERILAGEDFGSLARQHSTDAYTRDRGGTPPPDFRPSQLPPPLAAAADALAAGEVSPPVTWQNAVYLLEVTAIRDVPFESVRDELEERLRGRPPTAVEVAERKLALMRDVDVRVLPAMLR